MGKPERSFKCGNCEAAIFDNKISRNGKEINIKKVVFQKRYKDQSGEWCSTSSLDINDIPKAILALCQAYACLMSSTQRNEEFLP